MIFPAKSLRVRLAVVSLLGFHSAAAAAATATTGETEPERGTRKLAVVSNEAEAVAEVASIKDLLETNFGSTPEMKSKFLRLGFHDCIEGCDGCIDFDEPDNNGLVEPIDALAPIAAQRTLLSRADVWALAATWSAETMQDPTGNYVLFPFTHYGRVDCGDDSMAKLGPTQELVPSTEFTTLELLHFFATAFDFTPRETVAIMGAHSVGQASRFNSGYDGPNGWDKSNDVMDNDYYHQLVGKPGRLERAPSSGDKWKQVEIDNSDVPDIGNEVQWVRTPDEEGVGEIFMLHTDVALVRDLTNQFNDDAFAICKFRNGPVGNRCPLAFATTNIMSEYREDELVWLGDFRDALAKLLSNGHSTCNAPICF